MCFKICWLELDFGFDGCADLGIAGMSHLRSMNQWHTWGCKSMIQDDENDDVDDESQDEDVDNEFQDDVVGDEFQDKVEWFFYVGLKALN